MFSSVWEFRVKRELQGAFEKVYGPNGDWVRLFRSHAGYVHTVLLRDEADDLRYLTIDTWESRAHFLDFRERASVEFDALDQVCQSLMQSERQVGEYHRLG